MKFCFTPFVCIASTGILLLCPHSLLSQQNETKTTILNDVTVVGRATDLRGIASAASDGAVGRPELDARPILRSGDLLEVIPGFIATQHSGTGKANQYFLRGFNLDHGTDFSVSVEGLPINLPTHGHGQGYLDVNPIIPELIQRVDFLKGPYHAHIGDFSSAGAADIRLVDSLDAGFVRIGVGENAFYRMLAAESLAFGNGHLLAALELTHEDGPWLNPQGAEKLNGLVRISQGDRERGLSLTAMAYDQSWDSTDQVPRRAIRDGRVNRLGTLNPSNGGDTHRQSLILEGWRTDGTSFTRAQTYASRYGLDLWSDFTYFLEDPVNGDQFQQFDDRITVGGMLEHSRPGNGQRLPMEHTVGVQTRHDRIDTVGLQKTRDRRFIAPLRKDRVNQTSLGAYYQNTAYWHERVRSVLGVRGDAYFFDVDSRLQPENSGTADDQILSPKLSLIYSATDNNEVYASVGRGFHSNDARGTTTVSDPGSGEPVRPVDPLVDSTGAEVGLRTSPLPRWTSTLALWMLELDSELLFVGDAGTTEPSGKTRRQGIEWANYFKVDNWLTLDVDLAWVDAELVDAPSTEDGIPGAIPFVIAAGASAEFENGCFGSLRLRHFDAYPLNEDGSVDSEDSTLVNLRLGYRLDRHSLTFHVDVLNLFDSGDNDIEYFYASRLAGEDAAGVEDVHLHPLEPRTVRAYVTKTF